MDMSADDGHDLRLLFSCSCDYEPRLDHFPCACIIAVANAMDCSYTDQIPRYHYKATAKLAYTATYNPFDIDDLPVKEGQYVMEILAPPAANKLGRKAFKRKEKGATKRAKANRSAQRKEAVREDFEQMAAEAARRGWGRERSDNASSDVEVLSDDSSDSVVKEGEGNSDDEDDEQRDLSSNAEPYPDKVDEEEYNAAWVVLTDEAKETMGTSDQDVLQLMTTRVKVTDEIYAILQSQDQLTDQIMIFASIMIKNKHPAIDVIPDPKPAASLERHQGWTKVLPVTSLPAVRFIHLPGHWTAAWRMSEEEPVYYYDSLDPHKPGVTVINELTHMFAVGDEEVPCVIMSVQKQRGWKVCGVRAIVAGVLAMGGWLPQEISGLGYPRNAEMYKVMHGPKSHYMMYIDCSRYLELVVLWWNITCLSSSLYQQWLQDSIRKRSFGSDDALPILRPKEVDPGKKMCTFPNRHQYL